MNEPASAAAAAPIPTMDPEELHRYLVRVHRLENGLRFRFLEGLLAMEEGQLYSVLGYPSIFVYAQKHFGQAQSTTYEALRTVQALKELPRTKQAFLEGFAYSRVAEITEVASAETEEEWLAFASDTSIRNLRREVRDAKEKNRKRPRKGKYGLPGVHMRLPMDFAPAEFALLGNALKKLQKELSISLGGKTVESKAALLYLAQLVLKTDPPGALEGRIASDESIYQIIYHRCLDCHRDFLLTEDGAIEVPAEVVEAVEPSAEKVTIAPEEEIPPERTEESSLDSPALPVPEGTDPSRQRLKVGARQGAALPAPQTDGPNSRSFRRRLLLRDGCVCGNPMCGRRIHLHGHHLKARSKGGRTAFYNEIAVCERCHSLVELGYLKVEGDPVRGLTWTTKADGISRDLAAEAAEVAAIPVVVAAPVSRYPESQERVSRYLENREAGLADRKGAPAEDLKHLEDCVRGLQGLGATKEEASLSTRRAFDKLTEEGKVIGIEALLKLACRY